MVNASTNGKLIQQAPVLLVHDLGASVEYWRSSLGLKARIWGEPPSFVILKRDACFVMLSLAPADHANVPHWKTVHNLWNAYYWVADAKAIYEEFVAKGARIDYELNEKPHGVLEFGI